MCLIAGFVHAETREPSPWQVGGGLGLTMGGDELGSVDIYNSEGKRVQSENIRAGRLFQLMPGPLPAATIAVDGAALRSGYHYKCGQRQGYGNQHRGCQRLFCALSAGNPAFACPLTGIRLAWDFATISAQQRLRPAVARPSSGCAGRHC